jgi:hypothetical protein
LTEVRSGVRLIAEEGVLGVRDAASDPYVYVPVDVPARAAGLTVSLTYDEPGPTDRRGVGNILDLGLFEPGSLDLGTSAFRGWSGSERREVVVGERTATPGYLAGPIHLGRWHVVVGLCQVAPEGCRYRVAAEPLAAGDPRLAVGADPAEPRAPDPADTGPGMRPDAPQPVPGRRDGLDPSADPWWPGDLHCQTVHSDGKLTVAEIARFARAAGLAFLFVSDHNTTSHRAELAASGSAAAIALHPAEEVTTYRGHMGALGSLDWVDFRQVDPEGMVDAVRMVRRDGGLSVRNHPASTTSGWGFAPVTDAIEVWNGPWDGRNRNPLALDAWADELATGRRTIAVGGSDMHDIGADRQPIGTPVTWVRAPDPGRSGILDGLRAGRVVVSRTVAGPHLDVLACATPGGGTAGIGDTLACLATSPVDVRWRVRAATGSELRVLGPVGPLASIALDKDDVTGTLRILPADRPRFVRCEVRARDGALLALADPIHLEESA